MERMVKHCHKELTIPKDDILSFACEAETPFYLYDESTIRDTCKRFKNAFSWAPHVRNYFAVKATPNPSILRILKDEGFGVDCSSWVELALAEAAGFSGDDISFTSNYTALHEFKMAKDCGAIINLDDISHIDFIQETIGLPELLCFRYNPGPFRTGNVVVREQEQSKFGMTRDQIFTAIEKSLKFGVKKIALHTMVVSNCLDDDDIFQSVKMMFDLAAEIFEKIGVHVEMVNCGGGFGIPYRPEDKPLAIEVLSQNIKKYYDYLIDSVGLKPFRIVFECGRYITGPAGILVTRIIHQKKTYKNFLGVDACMSNLMRPALYNAYHHITHIKDNNAHDMKTLPSKRSLFDGEGEARGVYDVAGSLCENNDKFAKDRYIGDVEIGDLLVIHDTGAHGHCMGFNYNGKLRSAEFLRTMSGSYVQIRRRETLDDYLSKF